MMQSSQKKNYDAVIKYCIVQILTQKLIVHTNKQLKFTKLQLGKYEIF